MLIIYFFIFLNFFWILLSIAISANVIATNIIVTNFIITCNIANSLADNIMLRLWKIFFKVFNKKPKSFDYFDQRYISIRYLLFTVLF